MPSAMTSAHSALIRYSRPSDGPTAVICDAARSTGATVLSAFQNGAAVVGERRLRLDDEAFAVGAGRRDRLLGHAEARECRLDLIARSSAA